MPQVEIPNARSEDYQMPRLMIAQALSPEIQKSKPEFIKGLSPGDIFNTISRENFGPTVNVIPLHFLPGPNVWKEGDEVKGYSPNGVTGCDFAPTCAGCPNKLWGSATEGGVLCQEYRTYLVAVTNKKHQPGMMAQVSMKKLGLQISKRWLTLIRSRAHPMAHGVYSLVATEIQGAKGTYYQWGVNNVGVAPQASHIMLTEMFEKLKQEDFVALPAPTDDEL